MAHNRQDRQEDRSCIALHEDGTSVHGPYNTEHCDDFFNTTSGNDMSTMSSSAEATRMSPLETGPSRLSCEISLDEYQAYRMCLIRCLEEQTALRCKMSLNYFKESHSFRGALQVDYVDVDDVGNATRLIDTTSLPIRAADCIDVSRITTRESIQFVLNATQLAFDAQPTDVVLRYVQSSRGRLRRRLALEDTVTTLYDGINSVVLETKAGGWLFGPHIQTSRAFAP